MQRSIWQDRLEEFQESVAAARPAPAGVAASCVAAVVGLSLLMKVMRIRGLGEQRIAAALGLVAELKAAADEDIEGIQRYIATRDATGMHEIPAKAAAAVDRALELTTQISVTGSIAADVTAGRELLRGAAAAIAACIAANSTPSK